MVVKKSSQTNKASQPNSSKTSQDAAGKTTQVNSSGKTSQTSSAKSTQSAKTFPIAKSQQGSKTQASKATPNESSAKIEQKDRAIIPKSKIPPSVSNFEEVAQDPLKHILQFTKKRLRNLESRKDKLHGYQKKIKQGEEVELKKQEALSKYDEVLGSITLAEEFTNLFTFLSLEVEKVKERMQKSEHDRQRKQDIERSQFSTKCLAIFNLLASDSKIKEDFLEGRNNAVKLEQFEMDLMLKFSELCMVLTYNPGDNVMDKADKCGFHLTCLFNASPNKVLDSTYADIRLVLNKVCKCGYFTAVPDFTESSTNEEIEENDEEVEETSSSTEKPEEEQEEGTAEVVKAEGDFSSQNSEERSASPASVDQTETEPPAPAAQNSEELNKFTSYSSTENQPQPAATMPKSTFDDIQAVIGNVNDPQLQKIQMSFMSFQVEEQPEEPKEKPEASSVHTIEEVLADVQGQYDFLQDSMIDLDNKSGGGVAFSGQVMQPSAGASDAIASNKQGGEGMLDNQYNSVNERPIEKDSFLSNGPSVMPNEVSTSHLHHSTGSNSMYYVPQDKPADKFTEKLLPPGQDSQLKTPADNLGMGQTTFGANEPKYNVDIPPNSQYSGANLHSVDAYQQQSSDIARMKQLPENTFTNSPFSTLHGNSQSPFEGALTANKIPDPIPLPGNAAALSQTLAAAEPPTTHIPFPTDEMSGYRGYAGTNSSIDAASNLQPAEDRNEQFSNMQDKPHQNTLLSAGDAVHIPSPVLKLDAASVDNIAKDPVPKPEEQTEMASTSANNEEKSIPAQGSATRNTRAPSGYQNNSTSNYNRGNNAMPRQGQAMGGFYQNRSGGNYRPSHNRGYGNFDSMGHPKHFGGSGSGYQQGSTGMAAPFPSHYSRQDNGMYGGGPQRRGAGGSGRGNRGYPARMNNMRNGGGPNNNYNRSRTFRPQNSDQVI